MEKTVLIIDDDALLRRSLAFNLRQAGFNVISAGSAEEGIAIANRDHPALILLDINLPGIDGLEALRLLQRKLDSAVIFLTARRREFDQVLGLESGADDYITKPFDFEVLLARIKAVMRRLSKDSPNFSSKEPIKIGNLVIDPSHHSVKFHERSIELSPKEFSLLQTLSIEPGKVVSSDSLLAQVWGAEFDGEPQVLYVHMRWLREKLEKDPQKPEILQTIRGVGYRLNPEALE